MGTDYACIEFEQVTNETLAALDLCESPVDQIDELAKCVNNIINIINTVLKGSVESMVIANPNILEENMDTIQ